MKIRSRRIYTENGMIDGYMEIQDGRIVRLMKGDAADARDVGDLRVIPGIFDTHIHGTQGYSMRPEPEGADATWDGFVKGAASEGVTLAFPTPFAATGDGEDAIAILASLAERVGKPQDGATVAGIHFEGPYLNRVGEKGIREKVSPIDLDKVAQMLKAADGTLKLMGVAPELEGSEKLTQFLLDHGVTVAFTHTDCNAEEAFAAFDRGVSVATHLCNVMVGIHHRDVGGLGAALLDERVYCELICDGIHVCNDMLKIVTRAKDQDKIIMISDCTGYSGAPTGTYCGFLGDNTVTLVDELGFVREPGGRLRGSSKPVLYGIGNMVENVGLDMDTVLRMASLNPCRKYGFADHKGSLAVGKDADFVIISDDYQALETYVEGRKVFDRETEGNTIFNQKMLERYFQGK